MHQLVHLPAAYRIEHMARGAEIIALEFCVIRAADLRLQHHHRARAPEVPLPVARLGQIRVLDHDIGMHTPQHFQIFAVLVQHDELGVALRLEPRDQILADQPGTARQNDGVVSHSDSQILSLLKMARGK